MRLGRASLASGIAMLELLGAEFLDIGGEFGVVVTQLVELAAVMAVDFGLDRVGAGHRRLLGHQRGRRAEREAGDVPHRLQRGRPHAPLGHQRVEAVEMALFLPAMRAISLAAGELRRSTASCPA